MQSKPSQIGELLTAKLASEDPEWIAEAACANSPFDPFDPEEADVVAMLCPECPVYAQCEQYREEKGVTAGVWASENLSAPAGGAQR